MRGRIPYHLRRLIVGALVRPQSKETVYLGSDWGGWHVATDRLGPDSIVYSAGIGHDATFDLALIERFGCEVFGFDPTPIGREEGERVAADEPRFHFHPVGLWDENRTIDFFLPPVPTYDSYSITNLGATNETISCEVRRVSSLMRQLGHDHLDLLKIDIEGAEYAVIDDLLAQQIDVRQICVEFDQPTPWRKTVRMIARLRSHDYVPIRRKLWDYTFVSDH